MNIKLDEDLYQRLSERAKNKGFNSTEEYARVILETVIEEVEENSDDSVQERLQDLGYLE